MNILYFSFWAAFVYIWICIESRSILSPHKFTSSICIGTKDLTVGLGLLIEAMLGIAFIFALTVLILGSFATILVG